MRVVAALHKLWRIAWVVGGRDDKEAAGIFQTVRHNAAQDFILLGALGRRLRILDDIAPTAVKQPVIATAGAVRQVALLDQHRAYAAQRQVAQHAHAGRTTADHKHIGSNRMHDRDHASISLSKKDFRVGMICG